MPRNRRNFRNSYATRGPQSMSPPQRIQRQYWSYESLPAFASVNETPGYYSPHANYYNKNNQKSQYARDGEAFTFRHIGRYIVGRLNRPVHNSQTKQASEWTIQPSNNIPTDIDGSWENLMPDGMEIKRRVVNFHKEIEIYDGVKSVKMNESKWKFMSKAQKMMFYSR
ncbi:hypothetical protein ACOME3_009921 [Neoechinorhynchus agilis]